jgi:hypothetical protein
MHIDTAKLPKAATVKRKVRRYSPDRLRRQKLSLPGGVVISAETHNGRLVVRIESWDKDG